MKKSTYTIVYWGLLGGLPIISAFLYGWSRSLTNWFIFITALYIFGLVLDEVTTDKKK